MSKLLICLALLAGCYDRFDAEKQVRELGAVSPVKCIQTGGGYSTTTFVCEDGRGREWVCSRDGCVGSLR